MKVEQEGMRGVSGWIRQHAVWVLGTLGLAILVLVLGRTGSCAACEAVTDLLGVSGK